MVKGLKNKVALVTGAAQGIGRGIALRLAQEGAHIALVDMKQDQLNDVQQEIQALGVNASIFIANVSDREQVYAAINHAEQTLGGFDVMINNAGIAQVQAIADITPDEFQKIVDINIGGVLWGIQAAAAKFKQRQHKGKIINACSIAG
ncbi:MAG TPA: diacetyl reductase, partial [Acinetobacter baumannii]|nr:diacetyl reductase [Acinetobacter baumannii]